MDNLEIKEINDKKLWESFLLKQNRTPFLQSWNSGIHHELCGHKIYRYGLFDNNTIVSVIFLVRIQAKRGSHLFCPYGPIVKSGAITMYIEYILDFLKDLGKRENINFIKISPYFDEDSSIEKIYKQKGLYKAQIHILSENSWLLDLEPDEKEIFSKMRKTTRNLVRRAEKEGVTIEQSTDPHAVSEFYNLYRETGSRHKFVLYPENFIHNQVKAYKNDNQTTVFLAKYKGETISSAIVMYYGNEASYHHGASTHKYSKIPASYLLQWESIKHAKKRGARYYNFWGVYEGNNDKHPFKGITLFKKGFGGYSRKLVPCYDYPINKKYWFNYLIEKIRRIKRGF